jgi:hypothetical protein
MEKNSLSNNDKINKINEHSDKLIIINNILNSLIIDMKNPKSLYNTDLTMYKNNLFNKYKNINDSYPAIFTMIFNPKFNLHSYNRLKYMINMALKIEKNDITEHDASVAVGQKLVDEIVKPQLN